MGLPEVKITFSSKANTANKRSEQGVVMLVLEDTTKVEETVITEYKDFDSVVSTEWTAENLDYIEKTFMGSPSKVMIFRRGEALENQIDDVLAKIKNKRFNYLAVPGATPEEATKISRESIANTRVAHATGNSHFRLCRARYGAATLAGAITGFTRLLA